MPTILLLFLPLHPQSSYRPHWNSIFLRLVETSPCVLIRLGASDYQMKKVFTVLLFPKMHYDFPYGRLLLKFSIIFLLECAKTRK